MMVVMRRTTARSWIATGLIGGALLALSGCSLVPGSANPTPPSRSMPAPAYRKWPKIHDSGTASTTIVLTQPAGAGQLMATFSCLNGSTDLSAGLSFREQPGGIVLPPCIAPPTTHEIQLAATSPVHLDVMLPPGASYTLTGYYLP
jgi:hypothetical protein